MTEEPEGGVRSRGRLEKEPTRRSHWWERAPSSRYTQDPAGGVGQSGQGAAGRAGRTGQGWTGEKLEAILSVSHGAVVLEKTLESPLNCKTIKADIPKGINSGYSLEGLMLKLKLSYLSHTLVM